jgi:asparagine synthase (glutamine-hydrolysing)
VDLSAFTVVYERSNTPLDPGVLERVMERLKHRGPHGSDVLLAGHAALGHWHFWTTPEEMGERQPLKLEGLPFRIVLDGRLDNRPELISALNINPTEGSCLSDAALVLRAYAHWGEGCFEHFIGEYALAIFDERRGELLCARDALGDRTLFYAFKGTRLVIASEPWAVTGADGSAPEMNESAVAHYFALKATEDGQTLFTDVYELLPAHAMVINASGERTWRYWQPDPSICLRGKSDEEYAERFRALLEESVRCRLRSTTPVGVLMSGGLDSGSVACLAARMTAPTPLTTISYVFDELTDCDERKYIETIKSQWGLRSIQIPCDDAWPYKDWQNWPRNPNHPEGNAYRLLKERAYQRAHQEGLRVLMTGAFGDELYSGAEDWLADLIVDGRWRDAGRELNRHIRHAGWRRTLRADYLRRAGRRLLNVIPGGRRKPRPPSPPVWLTASADEYLKKEKAAPHPVFGHRDTIFGAGAALDASYEIFNASRHTLELRNPYRDRRLVEYVLTLPAHQLYYRGCYKHVLRTAMRGILPEAIRTRWQPTPLMSLYARGVEREKDVLETCFQEPHATWSRYVRPDWLLKRWNVGITPDNDGPQAVVAWLCVSFDSWYKMFHFAS